MVIYLPLLYSKRHHLDIAHKKMLKDRTHNAQNKREPQPHRQKAKKNSSQPKKTSSKSSQKGNCINMHCERERSSSILYTHSALQTTFLCLCILDKVTLAIKKDS